MNIKRRYNNLRYQLRGIEHAIANMYTGIINDDPRMIASELNYFQEKQETVKLLVQEIIDQEKEKNK